MLTKSYLYDSDAYPDFARFAATISPSVVNPALWWSSADDMLFVAMCDAAREDVRSAVERGRKAFTSGGGSGFGGGGGGGAFYDDSGTGESSAHDTGGSDGLSDAFPVWYAAYDADLRTERAPLYAVASASVDAHGVSAFEVGGHASGFVDPVDGSSDYDSMVRFYVSPYVRSLIASWTASGHDVIYYVSWCYACWLIVLPHGTWSVVRNAEDWSLRNRSSSPIDISWYSVTGTEGTFPLDYREPVFQVEGVPSCLYGDAARAYGETVSAGATSDVIWRPTYCSYVSGGEWGGGGGFSEGDVDRGPTGSALVYDGTTSGSSTVGGVTNVTYDTTNNYVTGMDVDLSPVTSRLDVIADRLGQLGRDLHAWLSAIESEVSDGLADLASLLRSANDWLHVIYDRLGELLASVGGLGGDFSPSLGVVDDRLGGLVDGILGDLSDGSASLASALGDGLSSLSGKFPFSVPWDVAAILALFVHEPVTPVFDLPLPVPGAGPVSVHVDLSPFDGAAAVARSGELVIFATWLALRTRDLLGTQEV